MAHRLGQGQRADLRLDLGHAGVVVVPLSAVAMGMFMAVLLPVNRLLHRVMRMARMNFAAMGVFVTMRVFMAMFVTAFSATLLGLGKSRGNATDVFSPMGEGETKSA